MTEAVASDLLYPLSYFCERGGGILPPFTVLEPEALPEPARTLLVHRGDMTSRLEQHYGEKTLLRVLQCEQTDAAYRREVVLCLDTCGLPVEYGAIEICLEAFTGELRDLIVEARLPLGGLLNRFGFNYCSEPSAFLELTPEARMTALFGVTEAAELYGRCNTLTGKDGIVLARIVEVLRPLETA